MKLILVSYNFSTKIPKKDILLQILYTLRGWKSLPIAHTAVTQPLDCMSRSHVELQQA